MLWTGINEITSPIFSSRQTAYDEKIDENYCYSTHSTEVSECLTFI